jgi:anaerobic magnesium-protoporphyrin IX monomethyl ester cyclase
VASGPTCGAATSPVPVDLDLRHVAPSEAPPSLRSDKRPAGRDRRVALLQPRIPDGNYLPNLGIMYLAGILLNNGYNVQVFDANIDDDVELEIRRFTPALLGITCVTAALGSAVGAARRLKDELPEMIVVLGGPHPTVMPKETLERNDVVDFCFIGESERSFAEFCDRLFESGGAMAAVESVAGMAWRDESGDVRVNRSPGYLKDDELDALPYPPWHLLPMERIFKRATHGLFTRGRRIMPVMTTRGCPNYCTFCSRVMGFNFRKRSIENVVGEILWLYDEWKTDEIYFEDDTFTQDPERAHALLDAVIDLHLPIHIKFANGLRADKVDESLLGKMKKAGVYWIGFGIESGSAHTQELMMKRLDLSLAAENVRLAKRMGFKVGSNCIIGYPGETREDARRSLDFFLRLPLDSLAVVPCVPFPGTTAWVECRRHGYFTARAADYDNYWFEIFKVNPLVETPHLSAADMASAVRHAYVRFYLLNPRRSMLVGKTLLKKALVRAADTRVLRTLRGQTAIAGPGNRGRYAGEDHRRLHRVPAVRVSGS